MLVLKNRMRLKISVSRKDIDMKLKVFILALVLLLSCGCEVEYYLTINERHEFLEEFSLITQDSLEDEQLLNDPFPYKVFYDDPDTGDYPEMLDGVSYYATEILNHGIHYEKKFRYQFLDNQFHRANSLHTCYETINVSENEESGSLTVRTSSKFLCMESFSNLNKVTIHLKSEKPIIVSNADEVVDDTYLWYINTGNYENHGIIFTFQKDASSIENHPDDENENQVPFIYVIGILGLFVLFLGIIFGYNYSLRNHK